MSVIAILAEAPENITDEKERLLYKALARVYTDYSEDNESAWKEKEKSFVKIYELFREQLISKQRIG